MSIYYQQSMTNLFDIELKIAFNILKMWNREKVMRENVMICQTILSKN